MQDSTKKLFNNWGTLKSPKDEPALDALLRMMDSVVCLRVVYWRRQMGTIWIKGSTANIRSVRNAIDSSLQFRSHKMVPSLVRELLTTVKTDSYHGLDPKLEHGYLHNWIRKTGIHQIISIEYEVTNQRTERVDTVVRTNCIMDPQYRPSRGPQ